jgi:hypothetical protein
MTPHTADVDGIDDERYIGSNGTDWFKQWGATDA